MAEAEKTKPDWEKFKKWEKEYEISVYRSLEPIEKLRILEDLYRTHLKIKQENE
ncbi:MAG: hypothetical protein ABIH66_03365 [bacterium]